MSGPEASAEDPKDKRVDRDAVRARGADVETLFEEVLKVTLEEPAPRYALPRLSTGLRRALLLALFALFAAGSLLVQGLRPDLIPSAAALVLPLSLTALAAIVSATSALRAMHRPPERAPWLINAALVATILLAALTSWPGIPATPEPSLPIHVGCAIASGLASGILSLVVLSLERADRAAPWRVARAAGAAALAAFVLQILVCPVIEPMHLFAAHTLPGLLFAAALPALALLRR